MCWECSTNVGRCEGCQRPQRPAAISTLPNTILATIERERIWMSEPALARWLGVTRRDIRRAVKRSDRLRERRAGFFRRTGRRMIDSVEDANG